ncbi:hypothetical protein ACOME3_006212 [Neoechinorhynchus agilis]
MRYTMDDSIINKQNIQKLAKSSSENKGKQIVGKMLYEEKRKKMVREDKDLSNLFNRCDEFIKLANSNNNTEPINIEKHDDCESKQIELDFMMVPEEVIDDLTVMGDGDMDRGIKMIIDQMSDDDSD